MTWVEWVKFLIAAGIIFGLFFGMCWAGDYEKKRGNE